ncbi:hypothetical protein [Streptomyces phaeolivaceus]|uniref:hypothetical protein n=1 Tax=Streptomyces phaeolivaceus TaxID=2653200 RepID=UPI00186AA844|nr:hypothetical protein [Streptomyces phaeolivaceus]
MSAPASFGDFFSSSGRLRRQWLSALQDPDPHSGLTKLRKIWAQWEKRPEAVTPFYVDFVRSVAEPPYRPLLTEADFAALESLSGRVAEAGDVPLDEAVRPLAAARFGRGEELPACELLTRLYWAESLPEAVRASVADELARSGVRDAPRIEVCADLLGRSGPRPPAVLALAAEVLRVDFSSDAERWGRAVALASTGLPGSDRAAGLHALQITGELDTARERFLAARAADPHDATALLGLLLACIRAGRVADIPGWALDAADETGWPAPAGPAPAGHGTEGHGAEGHGAEGHGTEGHGAEGHGAEGHGPAAPGLAATAALGRVLAWFDEGSDRPPPVTAARLAALAPPAQVSPWLGYARGRLLLLDGDAARARDLLVPLAQGKDSVPAWRYHAAWTLYLTGDRAGLWLLIEKMTRTADDWALACLLLDTEPHAVTGTAAEDAAAAVPPGYEGIARLRRDLAEGRRRPDTPDGAAPGPPTEGRGAPERLEALRTALGAAYGRSAGAADMAGLLKEPLYRRLPRADRLLWSGLLALRRDAEEGRRLLEAARALGHGRAALVLAAHHLEELRPGRAGRLLAELSGEKAELLRVWAEAVGGAADEVVEEGLGRLTAHRLPQVPYALGALRLHRIAGEGSTQEPEDAPYHARQAARELGRALATAPDAVPADAAVLARAARTVAHATAVAAGDGPAVLSPSVRQHPWAEWVLGLARLAEDPEAADPELCRRLVALAEEATPGAATALAAALTTASMRGTTPYHRDTLAHLLRTLAERHALPEIHALSARATAAALSRPAAGRPPVREGRQFDEPQRLAGLREGGGAGQGGGSGHAGGVLETGEVRHAGEVQPADAVRATDTGTPADAGTSTEEGRRTREGRPSETGPPVEGGRRQSEEGRSSDGGRSSEGARPSEAMQPVLALASAVGELARGDRVAAVRLLRAVSADGEVCALLADALEGRAPSAPPPDGPGERAALVRVVHAAGLVESDPRRSLELLSAAAIDCDLATVADLAHLLPALFAHADDGRAGARGAAGARPGGGAGGATAGDREARARTPRGGEAQGGGTPDEDAPRGPATGSRRAGGVTTHRQRVGRGQARALVELVKGLAGAEPPPVDAGSLGDCAIAVGEYATAAELWERALREAERQGRDDDAVRTRYALLLCHRAVAAHRSGDPLRGALFLHRAAAVLPTAGPATRRLPSRGRTAALARGLELDTFVRRLLSRLFPGAEHEPVPWDRPGRYPALEVAVRADDELTDALRSADSLRIERSWADGLRTWAYDVRLHHTLALLHRDTALGGPPSVARGGGHLARATVLWTLLLASERFWEQHGEEPAGPGAETRLRTTVCRELFALHRRLGAEALQAGERDTARLHLRVLTAVRTGESEVHGLLGEFGIGWSVPVDGRRWAEISALAGTVTDEWCAEAVLTAEKALRDPAAIAGLAEGIDQDYESAIDALRPLTGLGVPLPRLLQTALDWHNALQNCLYQMKRTEELCTVIGRARVFADQLAPFCAPGKGHLPGNRSLCVHFKYRGLFVATDSASASRMYRQALRWDPGDDNAAELLAQGAYTPR